MLEGGVPPVLESADATLSGPMSGVLTYHWILLLLAAPCVGSFLGVLIVRLPAGRPVAFDRSACPACGARLGARELVPLVSWVLLRARCRHCGAPVPARYPAIELAALGVALWALAVLPGWLAWAGAGLGWALLALAAIDARHLMLPDALTLPLVPAGLAVAWAVDPALLPGHLVGAAAGFGVIVGIGALYRRWRGREGIGLGDAKLFAGAGAWVSWQGLPSVLLIAAGAALLAELALRARRGPAGGAAEAGAAGRELPFGPWIAAGLWLTWLYGPLTLG